MISGHDLHHRRMSLRCCVHRHRRKNRRRCNHRRHRMSVLRRYSRLKSGIQSRMSVKLSRKNGIQNLMNEVLNR